MHDLLTDPVIRFDRSGGGRETASLPEVFAALVADEVDAFPALRPHQRHAWHAFLVQLGAIAMERAGLADPPVSAEEWRRIIAALTPNCPDGEPWQLMVDDIAKPAFMQPPVGSKEREADFKTAVATPDQLDMLVTSRNHDLKAAVAERAHVDDWVFALITLQTMEGFGGAGNYGISRMNGGLGNRPAFSLAPNTGGVGCHVSRDLRALLDHLPAMFEEPPFNEDGPALLWTAPWDGAASEALRLRDLHPLYIEICRRVRLRRDSYGGVAAVRATSKATRVAAKEFKGRTGDPWTPTDSGREGVPLTLSNGGFTYKRVKDYLLSSDWRRPALMRPTAAEQRSPDPMRLVARATVRGQGKTEGYYERSFIVRHRLKAAMFGGGQPMKDLGEIAKQRIDEVATVQRILSHAIQAFLAGGEADKASPEDRNRARPWLNRLDQIVDAGFFEDLQDEFDRDEQAEREAVRKQWLMGIVDRARAMLHDAADSLPCLAIYRYKARVNAEGLFEGRIRGAKGLPFLFVRESEEVRA